MTTPPSDDYNERRKALGMQPASDEDFGEVVAYLFMHELLAKSVADECANSPADERDMFMITYSAYLKWLIFLVADKEFPEGTWEMILSPIERELIKQPWYRPEIEESICNMMMEFPPLEAKGLNFGVLLPWGGAVGAANSAGFKLTDSTSMQFHIYVEVVSTELLKKLSGRKTPAKLGSPTDT